MNEYESLNHTKWECKYHVVFIPKYRRKALYGSLRQHLGSLFRELARHKECEIGEGHLMVDHVHMLVSIPPKYSVSQVMGYMKGKSAIHIARTYGGKRRNFVGQHFWARGYWVSTVGHNEAAVRLYIREQEKEDQRLDQLNPYSAHTGNEQHQVYPELVGSQFQPPDFASGLLLSDGQLGAKGHPAKHLFGLSRAGQSSAFFRLNLDRSSSATIQRRSTVQKHRAVNPGTLHSN